VSIPASTRRVADGRQRNRSLFAQGNLTSFALAITIALASLSAGGCDLLGPARPRSIIMITIDTLRRDHLSVYGYAHPTSPGLEALAARGTVFEDAVSASPWTRTSVATLFTGLYPETLGLTCHNFDVPRSDCDVLPASADTLAELFSAAGFRTAGFVANIQIDRVFGFAQGFDSYLDVTAPELKAEDRNRNKWSEFKWANHSTADVTNQAEAWIDEHGKNAFFLYLHYLDPHEPYDPPPGAVREMSGQSYNITNHTAARMIPRYDAEIRSVDDAIARLVAHLDDAGLLRTVGIVVVSDHGEAFGEHDGHDWRHGHSLFEHQLRVPMIAVLPGITRAGSRVNDQVGLLDVAPSVLDALGLSASPGMQGRSLVPLMRVGKLEPRGVLSGWGYTPIASYREPPWKLIWNRRTGEQRLYNLVEDPAEEIDARQRLRPEATFLHHEGVQILERAARQGEVLAHDTRRIELNREQRERLRSLGYLH